MLIGWLAGLLVAVACSLFVAYVIGLAGWPLFFVCVGLGAVLTNVGMRLMDDWGF